MLPLKSLSNFYPPSWVGNVLKIRILSAAVFAPVLLGLVWIGGETLKISMLLLALLMAWEFFRMCGARITGPQRILGYFLTMAVACFLLGWNFGVPMIVVLPLAVLGIMVVALWGEQSFSERFISMGLLSLGVGYAGGLIVFLALLRDWPDHGLALTLSALFCTWGADTGAYFCGRAFGKRKLAPMVSPNKTIEGAVGGVIAAVLVAFLIWQAFTLTIPLIWMLIIGVVAGVLGVLGDLCASLLKRATDTKDSSQLIPGHGGVLDRFDGVMFVAPSVYCLLVLLEPWL